MKKAIKILTALLICGIFFSTCKKYPDGGLHACARRNLLTKGDEAWQLKLYSVNGIDSTFLINTSDDPYYYSTTLLVFKYKDERTKFSIHNSKYIYHANLLEKKSVLTFSLYNKLGGPDQTEIFNPEKVNSPVWTVEKLKKKKLVLTANWNNSYTLIFERE